MAHADAAINKGPTLSAWCAPARPSTTARLQRALADFRKGGELVPGDGGFPYGEGQTYGKLGQHDKAVERYTEAIRRNATVTTYYRERGSAYGKFQEALADYDEALDRAQELEPSALRPATP